VIVTDPASFSHDDAEKAKADAAEERAWLRVQREKRLDEFEALLKEHA
jgi:hypothetical protein